MEYVLAAIVLLGLAGHAGYWWLCYRAATKDQYGVRSSTESR